MFNNINCKLIFWLGINISFWSSSQTSSHLIKKTLIETNSKTFLKITVSHTEFHFIKLGNFELSIIINTFLKYKTIIIF